MNKPKRKRVYRLSDLVDIAEQLGGRIQLDIMPVEASGITRPSKPDPELPKRKPAR